MLRYRRVCEIPFNSANKYQMSVHSKRRHGYSVSSYSNGSSSGGGQRPVQRYVLVMKGAPEKVLDYCSTVLTANGKDKPITEDFLMKFHRSDRT